jgi:hypothetical protein
LTGGRARFTVDPGRRARAPGGDPITDQRAPRRPRPRERILANLEAVYREAYQRAKDAGDRERMMDVDAAFQREQLLLEVLLDVRDALLGDAAPSRSALEKLETLRRLTKLK